MASKRSSFYNAPYKKPLIHDPLNENPEIKVSQIEMGPLIASEEVITKNVTKKLPLKRKNKRTFNLKESRKKIKNDTNPGSDNTSNATDAELNRLENNCINTKEVTQKMPETAEEKIYSAEEDKIEITSPGATICNSCSNSTAFSIVNENDIINTINALLSRVVQVDCENEENQISKEKCIEKLRPALKEILNKPHTCMEHTENSINKLNETEDVGSEDLQIELTEISENADEIFIKDKSYGDFNKKHSSSTQSKKLNKKVLRRKQKFAPIMNKKIDSNFNCINENNNTYNKKDISGLLGNISNDKQDSNETNTLNVEYQSTLLTNELKKDTKDKINAFIATNYQFDTIKSEVHMTSRPSKQLTIPNMTALDYEKENLLNSVSNSKEKHYKDKVSLNQDSLGSGNTNIEDFKDIEPPVNDALKESFFESFLTMTGLENGITKKSTNEVKLSAEGSNCSSNILPSEICTLDEKENKKPGSLIIPEEKTDIKSETKVYENQLSSNCTKSIEVAKSSFSIFDKEDFITENIIFRERNENEDDVIPTGVFQHLNEIFHYNKETTLVEPKCEILKHSSETSLHSSLELKNTKENVNESHVLEATTEGMEIGQAITLVANSDCIKSIHTETNCTVIETSSNTETSNLFDSDKNSINEDVTMNKVTIKEIEENIKPADDDKPCQYNKEEQVDNYSDKNTPMNKVINKEVECISSTEDGTVSQDKTEHSDFSDIENCLEMDDDFDLTASQLSMLDADEKVQVQNYENGKKNVEQQTDISIGHFDCENEIIAQLKYLRDCIEYIKDRIDK